VSSFFDVFLEVNLENSAYKPANKSLRLASTMPPPIPNTIFVKKISSTQVVLQWQNSFTLQTATSLRGPWTDVPGPVLTGPYTNTIPPGTLSRFFRVRQ
jgi:hypothetical protein